MKRYRWWLQKVLAFVRPRLVAALGNTVLLGLSGEPLSELKSRGPLRLSGFAGYATVHPSYLLRLPDEAQTFVPEALARPDYIYRLPGANVAVFVDGPVHDHAVIADRDAEAEDRLFDKGWDVVRFPYDADWDAVVAQFKRYFGPGVGV